MPRSNAGAVGKGVAAVIDNTPLKVLDMKALLSSEQSEVGGDGQCQSTNIGVRIVAGYRRIWY